MSQFTVETGKVYQATISLSGFEVFASNDLVASKFSELGFVNVTVTGDGPSRHAVGKWTGKQTTVDLPGEVKNPTEVTDVATIVVANTVHDEEKNVKVVDDNPAVLINNSLDPNA